MNNLRKIYWLCLLDSLIFGLTVSSIPSYILYKEGNNFNVGVLFSLHVGLQLLADPLIRAISARFSKKNALIASLWIGVLSNAAFLLVETPWNIVFVKMWSSLTNQTQAICKRFVSENVPEERQDGVGGMLVFFGTLGLVIGPIVGGSLFDLSGISLVCPLMSFLGFLSIVIAHTLKDERPQEQPANLVKAFTSGVGEDFRNFKANVKAVDFKKSGDVVAIRLLYCTAVHVFLTRFVTLLKHKFDSSCTIIGYMSAYQTALLFCSRLMFLRFRSWFCDDDTTTNILLQGFIGLMISLICLSYTRSYIVYLLWFAPLALSKAFSDSVWGDFLAQNSHRGNDLTGILEPSATLTNLLLPMVTGALCDIFGHYTVKFLTIVPVACGFMLLQQHNRRVASDDHKND